MVFEALWPRIFNVAMQAMDTKETISAYSTKP
jgi:hypothetical protein